jgi:hypothetical protein
MKSRPSDIAEDLLTQGHSLMLAVNTLRVMLMASDESFDPEIKEAIVALGHMNIDLDDLIKKAIKVRRSCVGCEPKRNWIQEFVGRF